MKIISSPAGMTGWAAKQAGAGKRIGLVPTMGFFHEGHLSLMRLAGRHADRVVVSLFVNPVQFGPGEDLAAYPHDFDRDRELAEKAGAAVLFVPDAESMYPGGFQTTVRVGRLTRHLCGASRPGHFDGVATVVCKLFHLTAADCAVFGEKDFQQLAVIRRMVADLNMAIEIIGHPIVREADGLALSSRNTYLDERFRASALCLSRSLALAQKSAAGGILETRELAGRIRDFILAFPGTEIDYIGFVHSRSLEPVAIVDADTRLVLAVKINDRVRLIDNGPVLQPAAAPGTTA